MSAYAQSSASKAKMLTMAVEWDDRAAAYDSSIYTVSPGFSHG